MKYIDITPAEFRCVPASCPSVKRAEDGSSYQITGKNVPTNPYIGGEATVEIDAALYEGSISAELVAARARIAALETALKPFAAAADDFDRVVADQYCGRHLVDGELLYRARAALSKDTGHE